MTTINEQKAKVEAEIKKLESMGGSMKGKLAQMRDTAFTRFPTIFVLLTSFGVVATFYGFEIVIDDIQFFANHPKMVLVTGVLTLIFTGTLYKRLS